MPDCFQEEANTRILFHLFDAVRRGAVDCSFRTVDTDVLALLVGKLRNLVQIHNVNIWVAFGTGKFFKDCETTMSTYG